MGARPKGPHQAKPADDHLLEAASRGWGVTIRFAILTTVTRWPPLLCGSGTLTLAAGYARARGWL